MKRLSAHLFFRSRSGRTAWLAIAYLAVFTALLAAVSHYYLLPATAAARDASEPERQRLAAVSMLLMAVVLVVLLIGLLLIWRIARGGRRRRGLRPGSATSYIDAWAESARRMPTPPPEPGDEP